MRKGARLEENHTIAARTPRSNPVKARCQLMVAIQSRLPLKLSSPRPEIGGRRSDRAATAKATSDLCPPTSDPCPTITASPGRAVGCTEDNANDSAVHQTQAMGQILPLGMLMINHQFIDTQPLT